MENIIWTDRVKNEEILHSVKEKRSIVHETERRKSNWFGHVLRRNSFLKHIIRGSIEGVVK
jgi:hypothetical protein